MDLSLVSLEEGCLVLALKPTWSVLLEAMIDETRSKGERMDLAPVSLEEGMSSQCPSKVASDPSSLPNPESLSSEDGEDGMSAAWVPLEVGKDQ